MYGSERNCRLCIDHRNTETERLITTIYTTKVKIGTLNQNTCTGAGVVDTKRGQFTQAKMEQDQKSETQMNEGNIFYFIFNIPPGIIDLSLFYIILSNVHSLGVTIAVVLLINDAGHRDGSSNLADFSILASCFRSLNEFVTVYTARNKSIRVGEDFAEGSVDDNRGDKTIEPVKAVHVEDALADGNAGVNAVCKSWKVGSDSNDKCNSSSPVDTVVITITSPRAVESWYVKVLVFNEPEIGGHDSGHWGKEYSISTHEGEEGISRAENLPWNNNPATDKGGNDTSALDIDVFRAEDSKIIGSRDGIGGDVGSNLRNIPGQSREESCSTSSGAHGEPLADDGERVPHVFSENDV